MKPRRSTPYAILGMLSIRPMSGYDIRKEAATSINYFWNESYGQIYPALGELAAEGLARRRTVRGSGRPDRHVYEVTPRGREALRRWLAEPPRDPPVRNELLLKLFFAEETSLESHVASVKRLLAQAIERLEQYQSLKDRLLREQAQHPSLRFWLITLSYGEHRSESLVRWCRETLAALGAKPRATPGRKARARKRAR